MPIWEGVGLLRQLNSSAKWQRHVALHDLSLDSNGWSVSLSSDSGKSPCILRNRGNYKGKAQLVKQRFIVLSYLGGREDGCNIIAFDFSDSKKVNGIGEEEEMSARNKAEIAAREFEKVGMSVHRTEEVTDASSNFVPDNFTSVMSSMVNQGVTSVLPSLTSQSGTLTTESAMSESSSSPMPSNFVGIMSSLLHKGVTSVMSSLASKKGGISENPAVKEYAKVIIRDPDFAKFVAEVAIFVDKEELFIS